MAELHEIRVLALDPRHLRLIRFVQLEELPDDGPLCLLLRIPVHKAVPGEAVNAKNGIPRIRVGRVGQYTVQWVVPLQFPHVQRAH